MADAGLMLEERRPAPAQGRVTAQLFEEDSECRLVIWADGQSFTVAVFPAVRSPIASARQSSIILASVQLTHARTCDDLYQEVI